MTTDRNFARRAHAMLMQVIDLDTQQRRDQVRQSTAEDPRSWHEYWRSSTRQIVRIHS